MYEKMLVPLDGSELAEIALPYVEELAGRLGSAVTLMYVREPADDQSRHMYETYMQKMVEITKQGAQKSLARLVGKEINVEPVIPAGDPAEEIIDYADKEKFGLIIMASHGRCGVGRWVLGSVADKVIRGTKLPVALIRAKGARPDVREKGILMKTLVPLDGSKTSEAVLPYVEELASKLKAEVTLLRVLTPDYWAYDMTLVERVESARRSAKHYIEKAAAQLKQKGIAVKAEFREVEVGAAAEKIIDLAAETNADLVAMATHGESGLTRWIFGSVAEQVLRGGNTPLLLVKAQ